MAKEIDITDDVDFEKIIEENKEKPTFVDFYANWCGPCKKLGPHIKKVCDELNCVLLKVNVEKNKKLAAKFKISGIPKVYLYKNGEKAGEFTGFSLKDLEKLKNSCQ